LKKSTTIYVLFPSPCPDSILNVEASKSVKCPNLATFPLPIYNFEMTHVVQHYFAVSYFSIFYYSQYAVVLSVAQYSVKQVITIIVRV